MSPFLLWAAVSVQFDPDVSLSGIGDTTDPVIREVSIAVDPLDPLNLAALFVDDFPRARTFNCRSVFTADGGTAWSPGGAVPLQKGRRRCGDPSLAADPAGDFYAAYLDINASRSFADILVARSIDGGLSWPTFAVAVTADPDVELVDKPFIGADAWPASPFRGALYVAYRSIGAASSEIKVVVSRNSGATWSAPVTVSRVAPFPPDELVGGLPVVAPDGTVYVFFSDYAVPAGPASIAFSRSDDGGLTWSPQAAVASGLPNPGLFFLKNAEAGFGSTAMTGLLANSFPAAAIGPDGTVHVAWADLLEGSCTVVAGTDAVCTNADVRHSMSADGGRTWTPPAKVHDDATATDQFLPWIAVHPDGLLSLIWLDRRLDPDNVDYDVFYTNTADGVGFLPNARINSATSVVGTTNRVGEYPGLAVAGDRLFPAWPDLRLPDSPEVFATRGTLVP